jgi:MtaA/CmuA family methyltransferase
LQRNTAERLSGLSKDVVIAMTGRDRVLTHLEGGEVDHLPAMPITMMFAADQIGVKYGEYVRDHRVLAEAQIVTATRFDFDYVSAISDPAREAADLGAEVAWFEDQPPAIVERRARLADKAHLSGMRLPNPLGGGRMHDRVKAIALLKERIGREKIVEGWIEGPCAQAADLRGVNTLMLDLVDDPGFVEALFEFVIAMELAFARAQVDAGAELIGIGDAAASLIGPRLYQQFVWPYERKLIEGVHEMGARVRLHICGRTRTLLPWMAPIGADIVDLDWMVPLSEARRHAGPKQVLLGNIDPVTVLRNGTVEGVTSGIAQCHQQAGKRYIVGAGCEVVRDSPEANVRALVEYAKTHKPQEFEVCEG